MSFSSSKAILTPEAEVVTPQPPERHKDIGTTPYTYANKIGTPMLTANPASTGDITACKSIKKTNTYKYRLSDKQLLIS